MGFVWSVSAAFSLGWLSLVSGVMRLIGAGSGDAAAGAILTGVGAAVLIPLAVQFLRNAKAQQQTNAEIIAGLRDENRDLRDQWLAERTRTDVLSVDNELLKRDNQLLKGRIDLLEGRGR